MSHCTHERRFHCMGAQNGCLACEVEYQRATIERLTAQLEKADAFIYSLDPCPKCWGMETDEPCTCSTAARVVAAEGENKRLKEELAELDVANATTELAFIKVLNMLRAEWRRENPDVPVPDFILMAEAKQSALEGEVTEIKYARKSTVGSGTISKLCDDWIEQDANIRKQQAKIERLIELVRLTRRQLWRAESASNPFTDDDEIPPAWNDLTEKLIQKCSKPNEGETK